MSGQLALFQHEEGTPGANIWRYDYAEDDELRRVLERRTVRIGYNQVAAGKSDRYLRKWPPKAALDFEMGRLLACELAAKFGAVPPWGNRSCDSVLAALIEFRAAYPGQKIVP